MSPWGWLVGELEGCVGNSRPVTEWWFSLAARRRAVYDRFSMIAVANVKATPAGIAPSAIIAPPGR